MKVMVIKVGSKQYVVDMSVTLNTLAAHAGEFEVIEYRELRDSDTKYTF